MKRGLLFIFGFLILLFGLIYFSQSRTFYALFGPTPTPTLIPLIELNSDKLWSLVNEHRRSIGLNPFIKDQRLCVIANDRVDDKRNTHEGFIQKVNNSYYKDIVPDGIQISENLSTAGSEELALKGWLNSPPHRKAIEGNWKYSCIATNYMYAVEIFSNFSSY